MSFATVYNTLNTLVKAGTLRELTIDPEKKRYDPDTSRHHHCICILCGKITAMAPMPVDRAATGGSHRSGRTTPPRGPPLWEAARASEHAGNDPLWDMSAQPEAEFEFDQRVAW